MVEGGRALSVLGFDVGGEWVGPGAQDVGGFLVQGVVGAVFLQESLVGGVAETALRVPARRVCPSGS
jgi:hypothetical protein